MSNHFAIATVTACLKSLLKDAIEADFEGFGITTVRPDAIDKNAQKKGVNIFLYRAAPPQLIAQKLGDYYATGNLIIRTISVRQKT